MPKLNLLHENSTYTFRSYFEMSYEPDDILAEFGYTFSRQALELPEVDYPEASLSELQNRLETHLSLASLSSEAARREVLVAPILLEVAARSNSQIRIEYPLTVNQWLKGTLDYLLYSAQSFLVVEAKNDDLSRGFTQLSIEMIALAQAENLPWLYGAVTIGDAWRFGHLNTDTKHIIQDIKLYAAPTSLEKLLRILMGILTGQKIEI